ncbi:MAG: sigma-70 family RNA polymerase sigma factor [Thermoanaerobaculia bacterium]
MGVTSRLIEWVPGLPAKELEEAWDRFLSEYASLILQVVHLFERDQDRVDDCFLFVCEQLKRDRLRRLRRFKADGAASFPTWLRAVVRNLCLDWRRLRFGRPRIFRSIARLPEVDQEVFRCIYFRKLSENETLHTVRALHPALDREGLAASLVRIRSSLSPHQSWLLVSRNPYMESLSRIADTSSTDDRERDLPDPEPDPESEAARREFLDALHEAMAGISPRERLLLRLRFEQDLSLEEISTLMQLGTPLKAQRSIQRALSRIREDLQMKGISSVSVEDT